jgi:hypothetical protein
MIIYIYRTMRQSIQIIPQYTVEQQNRESVIEIAF